MPTDIPGDAGKQAIAEFERRPAMTRGLLALAGQVILALPLAMLLGVAQAMVAAGIAVTCFLLGHQAGRAAPFWHGGPGLRISWAAARLAGYPAIATAAAALLAAMLAGGA